MTVTRIEAEQVLCRFQLSSRIQHGLQPLFAWIVETARQSDLQGATVLKGFYGMRSDGAEMAEHAWSIAQDLPVVVEVVDTPERVEALIAQVEPSFRDGVITLERAHVVIYGGPGERSPADRAIVTTQSLSAARGVKTMTVPEEGVLLRIFIGESDREPGGDRPLYEAIVLRAREAQLAGATVLRGPMGFGRHSRVHSASLLALSTDLPVVIEIVDAEEKIARFLPRIDELVTEGLVTLEAVRVLRYVSPDRRR